jgi:hypothetical protein
MTIGGVGLAVVVWILGYAAVGEGSGGFDPSSWMEGGQVVFDRVPDRIPVAGRDGRTAGYADKLVFFDPPGGGEHPYQGIDGPYPVYANEHTNELVGVYFHSLGFIPLDEWNSPSFSLAERHEMAAVTVTTMLGGSPGS